MPNAAIISANNELVRFYELELYICGYSVCVYKNAMIPASETEIIFWDTDTVSFSDALENNIPVVLISSEVSEQESGNINLPWPTAISDIRRALMLSIGKSEINSSLSVPKIYASDMVYVLDRDVGVIMFENREIKLSKTEFAVLRELCTSNFAVVSRDRLKQLLGASDGNIVDVYICSLRKKLELPTGKRIIYTQRGVGYSTALKFIE